MKFCAFALILLPLLFSCAEASLYVPAEGNGKILIENRWSADSTNINVYMSETSGEHGRLVTPRPLNGRTLLIPGLVPGKSYYFVATQCELDRFGRIKIESVPSVEW